MSENKHIKAIIKIARLMLWVGMGIGIAVAFAFSWQAESSMKCNAVNVRIFPHEVHFYNRARLINLVRKGSETEKKLVGLDLGDINTSRLENMLKAQPYTLKAKVYSDLDGELNIAVNQRIPLLRLERYDGFQYYIDKEGVKMPLSDHYISRVLLANGNVFERFEKGDSLYSFVGKQVFKVASYVDKDAFLKAFIEQIFVRADNEMVLVPTIGEHVIILGDAEDLEEKFSKLLVFYKEGLNRIGWNKYKSIDLRMKGQVVCKK